MAQKPNGTGTGTGGKGGDEGLDGSAFDRYAQRLLDAAAGYSGPSNFRVPTRSTTGDSNSSSTNNSSYTATGDYTSGQDAANAISQALMDAEASEFAQLMTNPIAAVATGDRIRKLQEYIKAYRGGYQLPDQVVIPHARLASDRSSTSTTGTSSGGSRTNAGTKEINNPDYDFAKAINDRIAQQHIQNRFAAD
jgi:hypothetical protein